MTASMLAFLVKIIKSFDKVDYLKFFHLSTTGLRGHYLSLSLNVASGSTSSQIGLLIAGIV